MNITRSTLLAAVAAAALLAACSTSTDLSTPQAAPVETRQTTPTPPKADAATSATPSATPQSRVATVDLASAGSAGAAAQAAAAAAWPAQRVIYFDFDSFVIKDDFKATVEGHARVLAANPSRRITIEGHTDERGGHEYNLALGQKRAEAVVKALELLGAADNQLEAVSFGEERPADPGHDESAWAKNRRAELKDR